MPSVLASGLMRCNMLGGGSSFARTSRQLQIHAQRRWSAASPSRLCSSPSGFLARNVTRKTHTDNFERTAGRRQRYSTISEESRSQASEQAASLPKQPPALAPYKPPTTGLISYLPSSWIPYAELARLQSQAGTHYLFLPCVFSTLLAAPLTVPVAPPSAVLGTIALFYSGAVIMRGAGCTVNDLWDRNLDPHVARTRLRPIARGAITVNQAIPFLGAQLLAGLVVLLQFPTPCFFYATPSLLFVATYPLAKRVTNYPQFVLGLTFSWGAMLGFPALGISLLENSSALISAACLYGSCVAWTLVYDMIYAYQDIRDDAKVGIKSIALAQAASPKTFLSAVSAVQVALLAGTGAAVGAGPVFYLGVCGGATATLAYMIRKVNLDDVANCWAWFRKGAWFTGGAISLGLAGEYVAHLLG